MGFSYNGTCHSLHTHAVLTSACPPQCAAETEGVILDFGPSTGSFGMTARLAAGVMRATDVVSVAAPSLPGAPLPCPTDPCCQNPVHKGA